MAWTRLTTLGSSSVMPRSSRRLHSVKKTVSSFLSASNGENLAAHVSWKRQNDTQPALAFVLSGEKGRRTMASTSAG